METPSRELLAALEQYFSVFAVRESVDELGIVFEPSQSSAQVRAIVPRSNTADVVLRLRESRSGTCHVLEERRRDETSTWTGQGTHSEQTAGLTALVKRALDLAGFDPEQLPVFQPRPQSQNATDPGRREKSNTRDDNAIV